VFIVAAFLESGISASQEDYLLTICRLVSSGRVARSKEIADAVGVTASSVTSALRQLHASGHIHYDRYSYITLTARGEEVAGQLQRRHTLIRGFLSDVLGMPQGDADANACRIEHALDPEVCTRLNKLMRFLQEDEDLQEKWKRKRGT
jgi:DtxR family Mn-dependent transcriptional regulator